jgi:hypothetical protein
MARNVGVMGPVDFTQDGEALVMYQSGTTLYVCKAHAGAASSAPVWQIQKVDTASGVVIQWCNGNDKYTNTATDLATVQGHDYA